MTSNNLYLNFKTMSLYDFTTEILKYNNIESILNQYDCINGKTDNNSVKGFIYEALWDIIIKLGLCKKFSNVTYSHVDGNINNGKPVIIQNLLKYFKENKLISGNSSGSSDITLYNKNKDEYTFITCKYIKLKSIEDLDIQKIIAVVDSDKNKCVYKNYKILICVKDKYEVLQKSLQANKSSDYIKNYINDNTVLDLEDLNEAFIRLKRCMKNITLEKMLENSINKTTMNLYFHQELFVNKTFYLITKKSNYYTDFLWGCKCRSGKTYMVGGLIEKMYYQTGNLNVLVITPAPSETIPQFTKDLFEKYINFSDFNVCYLKGNSNQTINITPNSNNIFIASKQFLQSKMNIINIPIDIIFFDENHFSGTTNLSKHIIQKYSTSNTIRVFLTATYNKPLSEWNIPNECQFFWDIEDEQFCKNASNENMLLLEKKHGKNDINKCVNKSFANYKNMPDLHIITNLFDLDRFDYYKECMKQNSKYGFSFETLFSLTDNKEDFMYKNEIKTFISYISGSHKELDNHSNHIFTRINKLTSSYSSRNCFTQIWFLPSDNINEISLNLKSIMLDDKVLSQYHIICINRKNKDLAQSIKNDISREETYARSNGKRGVILLSGNMLSLGITLENCDVVMMLNNTTSSDKIIQQMYRCMSENENKKMGIVVDMNTNRVLSTLINYNSYKKYNTIEDHLKYIIEYNLINIDRDLFVSKQIYNTTLTNTLMQIWKAEPVNSIKSLLYKMYNEYICLDDITQKQVNTIFLESSSRAQIKKGIEIQIHDEQQVISNGKNITLNDITLQSEKDKNKDSEQMYDVSFTKDILPYIIPLACILTISDDNTNFLSMLESIKNTKKLLEVFNEQTQIWWNKTDLIDFIEIVIKNNFDKNSTLYNVSMQIKMSLKSLIDQPEKLLEFISDSLKPKESEKKKYGEVFTPMSLVNEMLDTLPKEVWTNKSLKWFDPASGMGNFPIAVYLRLMESLKTEIPNKQKRKKWILEEMLYMSELNSKNVMICKQIFDVNDNYKLNLYCGDSLKLDTKEFFGIESFDIVMGNPPYQEKKESNKKTKPVWNLFVSKSYVNLKSNGYLLLVHPSGWRSPDGIFKATQKLILSNNLIYLNMNGFKKGLKTFHCSTNYDYYLIKKEQYKNNTIINDIDNTIYNINLSKYNFIPSGKFNIFEKLITNNNKTNVIYSRSIYGTDKKNMCNIKNNEYKYPCCYSITTTNGLKIYYSNIKKEHFGIKKIIWSNGGGTYPIIDYNGEYGLTQFCYGIEDSIENLEKIKIAMESNEFINLMKYVKYTENKYNYKVMSLFKKDFWKEFI